MKISINLIWMRLYSLYVYEVYLFKNANLSEKNVAIKLERKKLLSWFFDIGSSYTDALSVPFQPLLVAPGEVVFGEDRGDTRPTWSTPPSTQPALSQTSWRGSSLARRRSRSGGSGSPPPSPNFSGCYQNFTSKYWKLNY